MDRQEVTLLVLIYLSAAFNTIDHAILLKTLEKDFGVTRNALKCHKWLTSYLSKRKQTILINRTINRKFSIFNRECRSVAVLALSSSYSTWLDYLRFIDKHLPNAHTYAGDTQIYHLFRPDTSDIRAWVLSNRL
jgi:hypothetical protein